MPVMVSIDEVRRFVGDGEVTYLGHDRLPQDPPASLGIRMPDAPRRFWAGDLTQLHAEDRTRLISTFKQIWARPGSQETLWLRARAGSSWTRYRVRYLNLFGHPDVDGVLQVVDRAEPMQPSPHESLRRVAPTVPWVRLRYDFEGKVVAVEGMAEHLYGVPGTELIGRSGLDLVPPDEMPTCLDAGLRAFANPGEPVSHTHQTLGPGGQSRLVDATLIAPGRSDEQWDIFLVDAERAMHAQLLDAIDTNQFTLAYQAVVGIATEAVVGAEALLRWQHPTRGNMPPLSFIPLAEATGAIVDIGAWVLASACAQAATWPGHIDIAVNLSVRQLADPGIVGTVADALAASGLAPNRLVLEVTESALIERPDRALDHLRQLKSLGIRLAIDDFGTGYSSLLYLKQMPVDLLKIDRSFVSGLGDNPGDTAIVSSIVSLAHAFGLAVVGEGVEHDDQHHHLRILGCDLAQGYLWSRPGPPEELRALAARQLAASHPG
jgi:EAL domain-containing protein (putative c-di-GMP-specific phosphodiesterase class I)/PAS domain-containing protein